MLILVPALLSAGILLATTEGRLDYRKEAHDVSVDVFSMAVHHRLAIQTARDLGFPAGDINVVRKLPFRDTRVWKSQVAATGNRRILLTWTSDFNPQEGIVWPLQRATIFPWIQDSENSDTLRSITGPYRQDVNGNHWIGTTVVPVPQTAITDGALAIATWLR